MRTVFALVVTSALACADAAPTRLVPLADPFVYNGSSAIALPIVALGPGGDTVSVALSASSDDEAVASVSQNSVRCLHAGDARISVQAGLLNAGFVLHCRPIESFGPPLEPLDLVLGGPSVPLAPVAYDSAGHRVSDLRFSAVAEDTTIAVVQHGAVVPRSLGATRIRLDFGGIVDWTSVEVVAPIVRESVQLAATEYRRWPLGPGRYIARLIGTDGAAARGIQWRSANANCAFDPRSRATLHCVLADSGVVIAIADAPAAASVRIDQRAR